MENISTKERNRTAIISGIILGIIYILITTAVYKSVGDMKLFYTIKGVGYVAYLAILGAMTARVKKANGGYLDFKDTFGTIFIILLIANVLYYIYNYAYHQYIDPQLMYKMKASSIDLMRQLHATEDKIKQTTQDMDREIAASKTFNLSNNLMSFLGTLLTDCFFGLVVAAVVKKNKPAYVS